jgi:hypothetical protein
MLLTRADLPADPRIAPEDFDNDVGKSLRTDIRVDFEKLI